MKRKAEGAETEITKITTDVMLIWDARYNLNCLISFLGAALFLAKPDDEDPAKTDIITALCSIQEMLTECAEALDSAIKGGTITTMKNAPAAVPAAAGA
ncbi:MAG: hypothetical protein ACOYOS_01605 [Syntrophales bacterium]